MDILKNNIIVGLSAGVAATLLAPVLVPALAMAARPLAKSLLKGGVILYEKGREALAGAGEEMEDLIAEVRAEMSNEYGYAATGTPGSAAAASGQGDVPAHHAGADEEQDAGLHSDSKPRHSGNGAQAS